jgi:hypothetical protein
MLQVAAGRIGAAAPAGAARPLEPGLCVGPAQPAVNSYAR